MCEMMGSLSMCLVEKTHMCLVINTNAYESISTDGQAHLHPFQTQQGWNTIHFPGQKAEKYSKLPPSGIEPETSCSPGSWCPHGQQSLPTCHHTVPLLQVEGAPPAQSSQLNHPVQRVPSRLKNVLSGSMVIV